MQVFSKELLMNSGKTVKWDDIGSGLCNTQMIPYQGVNSSGSVCNFIYGGNPSSSGSYVYFISYDSHNSLNYYSLSQYGATSTQLYNSMNGGYYFGSNTYRTSLRATATTWSHPFYSESHIFKIGSYFYLVGNVYSYKSGTKTFYYPSLRYTTSAGSSNLVSIKDGTAVNGGTSIPYFYIAGKNAAIVCLNSTYYMVNGSTSATTLSSSNAWIQIMGSSVSTQPPFVLNNRVVSGYTGSYPTIYDISNINSPTLQLTFNHELLGGYTGTTYPTYARVCPIGTGNKALGVFSTHTKSGSNYYNNLYWSFYDGTSWTPPEVIIDNIYSYTNPISQMVLYSLSNGAVGLFYTAQNSSYYNISYYLSTDSFKGET